MRGDSEARARQIEVNRRIIGSDITAGKDVDASKFGQAAADAQAERARLEWDIHLAGMLGVPDELKDALRGGQSLNLSQRRWVENMKDEFFQDREWVQRYMAGNMEAKRQMRMLTSWLAMPVER